MNQALQQDNNTAPTGKLKLGDPVAGGFYIDAIMVNGVRYGFALLPKAEGEFIAPFGSYGVRLDADHLSDGLRNTEAMAAAGHEHASKALANDCYIWSRDEMELCYRHLKPTMQENLCGFRDGENPNSLPPGQLYTPDFPAQTTLELFQEGGAEAFEEEYYGCSTQSSAYDVFVQAFSDGAPQQGLPEALPPRPQIPLTT